MTTAEIIAALRRIRSDALLVNPWLHAGLLRSLDDLIAELEKDG